MKRYLNEKILVFADYHSPFQHKDALDFLADIARESKPDRVIINGDLTDSYNFSQYAKDLNTDSPVRELKKLQKDVGKLIKVFPKVIITDSNHDARLWRKAKIAGIPRELLLPYLTMIGADKADWSLVPELTLTVDATREQWFFMHHMAGAALNSAKGLGSNVVLSHQHTKQGCYRSQGLKHSFWAVDTGCLIDEAKYAFAYQKLGQNKPVLGCALIEEGVPRIIPMDK